MNKHYETLELNKILDAYDNTIKEDNTYLNEANTIAYNEKVMVPLCLYV